MAITFTNCSKDDSEPDAPKVAKRMKSIDDLKFTYSDGKIVQVKDGSYTDKVTYTESTIKIDDQVYYLNNEGLVSKFTESDGSYQEFTYKDGRINTWKKYYRSGGIDEDISFEWKDGVIVRQTQYDGKNRNLFCDYQYTYTKDLDYGGAVACFQSNSMFYDDLPECLIVQGYFGKWPKYLVSGAVDMAEYFDDAESYTYILDSDGYPVRMSGTDKATFSWEEVK
ncbi:MAG: hypothetical protein K2K93_06535 [Muribaculaceae bacterium]|nr:hypothetical protein [Muribaculaceae bacterium]